MRYSALILPDGSRLDPLQMCIEVGGEKFQVIGLESHEELNAPYSLTVTALMPVDRKFVPKLPMPVKLTYRALSHSRTLEGVIAIARQSGMQHVEAENGKGMYAHPVWYFTIRPALYSLLQDRGSDVYENTSKHIIESLLGKIQYQYIGNDRPKRTFVRYDQLGLEFWDQLISGWNLQYFFYNGLLYIAEDLSHPPETYSVAQGAILESGINYRTSPGSVEAVTYEPEKSVKPQSMKRKISDTPGTYQVHSCAAEREVLNLAEQLTSHPEYEFILDGYTHLNVGCRVKFPGSKVFKECSIIRLKHSISSSTGAWISRARLWCTLANKIPLFCRPKPAWGVHEAVVVGVDPGTVVVDKCSMTKIRYVWQKSEVEIPATIGLAACGAGSRGTWAPPHVGDRVVVVGMHGDLLRPTIEYSLADANNKPPLSGDAQLTQQIMRTAPLGKAPPTELRIENKANEEAITLQAPGDLNINVHKNWAQRVEGNAEAEVKGSCSTKIKEGSCTTELLGKNVNHRLHLVHGNIVYEIDQGNCSWVLKSGDCTTKSNLRKHEVKKYLVQANEIEFRCGGCSIKMTGSAISIDAGTGSISLTGSKIDVSGKSQVAVRAPNVQIDGKALAKVSGGTVGIDASAQLKMSGGIKVQVSAPMLDLTGQAKASLSSSGITTVQGGLVKLN